MLSVDVGGETLILLPEKAVFVPRHDALLVADAHFGKSTSFRRLGVPVPRGTTGETLDLLDGLLDRTAARRIVFLGDFLHSSHVRQAASTLGALARWRARRATVELTLLRGNHDRRAGDPPGTLGIEVVDEPLPLGTLALRHHPSRDERGAYTIAGHLHPCIWLPGRAHDRLRVACFHFGRQVGVLPAFGAFTGMQAVSAQPGDRVYAIAGDRVVAWPPGG